jgi:hypothetical protein
MAIPLYLIRRPSERGDVRIAGRAEFPPIFRVLRGRHLNYSALRGPGTGRDSRGALRHSGGWY